jgi:hypothetical protein
MKKIVLLVVLLLAVALALVYFFVIRGKSGQNINDTGEKAQRELPLGERPLVTLTPTADGHWLNLVIAKIDIDAEVMEYDLLYKLPGGQEQGTGGTVQLKKVGNSIERELLLGTESSGNYYYDEDVEFGTLIIKFRDRKGSLIAKIESDFHLISSTDELTSSNGEFKYKLDDTDKSDYFVVINTLGIPDDLPGELNFGPYGIFSSSGDNHPGAINMPKSEFYVWNGDRWKALELNTNSQIIGIFAGTEIPRD